jgi:Rps23 Pro-64 3,4-dihydroxylase Tpa1-like proline 4-hydroxylase
MSNNKDKELIKICNNNLEIVNSNDATILNKFGDWTSNTDILKETFLNALPFEHVVIDNFLNEEYANQLCDLFPKNLEDWYKYENPIEVKYSYDDINKLNEPLKNYFYYLSSDKIINIFRKLTNIEDLTFDEYLHGAGLHCHPRYGKLNIHLDYEKHPFTGKERRLNIILFLNKHWEQSWNGQNELWNQSATERIKKTDIKFNRAVIFKTNDISWHGLPDAIMCPEGESRKTLAYYYVSPLNSVKKEEDYRLKAKYIITDTNETNENKKRLTSLCEIRSNRRLTSDDVQLHCPDWKKENV